MLFMPIAIQTIADTDDREYMEQVYRQHYRLMYAIAWRYSSDLNAVEDIVSDSCVSLIRNLETLRELDERKQKAYIVIAVKNTAFSHHSRNRRHEQIVMDEADDWLENQAAEGKLEDRIALREELENVWRAIQMLPPKEQQIMQMKYQYELSDKDIAERVGLAESSIRKYISRARERIRSMVYVDEEG